MPPTPCPHDARQRESPEASTSVKEREGAFGGRVEWSVGERTGAFCRGLTNAVSRRRAKTMPRPVDEQLDLEANDLAREFAHLSHTHLL
jgi:hypothetical protein